MSLSTVPTEKALAEASDWFARLKKRDVPAADMEAFRVWRKAPGHKEAYDLVDAFWKKGETLQGDPDIQAAMARTLERTQAQKPARRGRQRLGLGLAFAGAVLACAVTYVTLAPRTYATEVGERRTVRLADGSTLTLDTNSAASVRFTKARRDIRLEKGQALFDVAHDAARPFVVKAGATSVTALGTRFDVRRDAAGAVVTLVRGAVEVREASGPDERVWRLAPGQRLATAQAAARPAAADVASATSWTSGRLVFHDVPLRAAVAEFNRYERRKITLEPGPWDEDRISGAFDVGDTRTFVGSVAELHDLTVSMPEKGEIRLSRAGGGDAAP